MGIKPKQRKKKCVNCGKSFMPFKTTQRVCSTKCAMEWSKARKQEQREHLELFEKEIKDKKKLKSALETTRLIVHEAVRLRDKGKPCISCQTPYQSDFQAGHYFKAELYSELRYDFNNIHGQCKSCNMYYEGNLNGYSIWLPQRIGQQAFDILNSRGSKTLNKPYKWTLEELAEIRKEARAIIKKLS